MPTLLFWYWKKAYYINLSRLFLLSHFMDSQHVRIRFLKFVVIKYGHLACGEISCVYILLLSCCYLLEKLIIINKEICRMKNIFFIVLTQKTYLLFQKENLNS